MHNHDEVYYLNGLNS